MILEHVALMRDKSVMQTGRFTCTTCICSMCGHYQPMPPRERRFVCDVRGLDMDRDHNGARNVLTAGGPAVLSSSVSLAPVGMSV